jgi:uncharacterized membrane protein
MVRAHTLAGLVASFACAVGAFAQGCSFTLLESTEPNVATSRGVMARAISGNGRVIAGTSAQWQLPNPPYQFVELPYVWIQQNNCTWQRRDLPMLGRPDVPPEQALPMGRPLSINFDGSIIGGTVGPRVTTMAWNPGVAGVWTNVLGQDVQVAHAVPNDPFEARSYICGMSRDGQTMLTFSQTMPSGSGELLLISGADVSDVGGLDQQWFAANYMFGGGSLSGDGAVVALTNNVPYWNLQPHRWTSAAGAEPLPYPTPLLPSDEYGNAWVVSADGRTVGGWIGAPMAHSTFEQNSYSERRFPTVWTDGAARVLPSRLFGRYPRGAFFFGRVTAISGDGRVIAGVLNSAFPVVLADIMWPASNKPALWIGNRLIVLDELLVAEGVDLQGVLPRWIAGISEDGSTIAGWGTRTPPGSTVEHFVSFVATILPPGVCDDIDFNRDGNRFDPLDIEAFLSVFSEGPCLPAGASCRDIDFNNDGSLFDPEDVDAFLRVFSEGPCTL